MFSHSETKSQQLQKWLTSFAKEVNENETLREKIHEQLFLYSVASQHQLKKHKLILANYFCEQIIELIQKEKKDKEILKLKKLFHETLVKYMIEHITDEKAHDYFYEYLATFNLFQFRQSYPDLISRVKQSIQSAILNSNKHHKNNDDSNEILQNFSSINELTVEFLLEEKTNIKKKAKLEVETGSVIATSLFVPILIGFEAANLHEDLFMVPKHVAFASYSLVISLLIAFVYVFRSPKDLYKFEYKTAEDKPMKEIVFQVERLAEYVPKEYQPLEYKAGKPSDTTNKKADTSKQEEQCMEDPQNNSKTENNNNAGISNNNNSKSSKPYSKAKLFKPKNSKKEQEPVDLNTCTMAANNKTFALPTDKVRSLIRGTRTAPPIDGKFVIYFDKTELRKIEHKKHNKVAKEAIFHPGAAEGKDCIHYLGNGIWSMKCSTNDIRVLGTVIGTDQNNKKIIYFWKLVDHKEQKRLLRDAAKLKAVLSTPPEIVYTAKEQTKVMR